MRLNFQKRNELKVVSRIIPEAKRRGKISTKPQISPTPSLEKRGIHTTAIPSF